MQLLMLNKVKYIFKNRNYRTLNLYYYVWQLNFHQIKYISQRLDTNRFNIVKCTMV